MFKWIVGAFIAVEGFFGFGGHPDLRPITMPPPALGQSTPGVRLGGNATSAPLSAPQTARTATSSATVAPAVATAPEALPIGSELADSYPLGDGKYVTSSPKQGYIYLCHIATGGGGAEGNASWIHGSSWSPSEKVAVEGNVSWPDASYAMTVSGATRSITGNGLPTDHASGVFPIQKSDPAYQFDANPNSIKAQAYDFSLPAYPAAALAPDCIFGEVGIMNDGVALFDGFDAEYRDAVAHETQDAWEAHPDEAGVYHYHGFETGYLNDSVSTVVGFAFDGFPITGGRLPSGNYVVSADLDECHGMTSTITLDGKQVSTYHYVLTPDFPYSVACFHGTSHEPKPGAAGGAAGTSAGGQGSTQSGQSGPPQAAVSACSGLGQGAACSFTAPNGTITGSCKTTPDGTFACVPQ